MRIVAGMWRGRHIAAPKGMDTRPTSDRVREALFSALTARLGPDLGGIAVLDAFAGTGALGLEALSRGTGSAVFLEEDRRARACVTDNAESLGAGGRARIVAADAFALAKRGGIPGGPFGLILLDPPYRIDAARIRSLLEDLVRTGAASQDTVVVWEHAADRAPDWPDGFTVASEKRYGSTGIQIAIHQHKDDA